MTRPAHKRTHTKKDPATLTREQAAADVASFLASGGEIQAIPTGKGEWENAVLHTMNARRGKRGGTKSKRGTNK